MLARIWLAPYLAILLASHPATAVVHRASEGAVQEAVWPPAEHDLKAPQATAALRMAERAKRLEGPTRAGTDGGAAGWRTSPGRPAASHLGRHEAEHGAGSAGPWCDVVQCRRMAGAHLLRRALAPPHG